jgi:two-component system NtrC family sensor kinase
MYRYLRGVSLRARITISFVLIVVCGTAVSTSIGSRIITSAMRNEALKQVRHGLEAARMVYDSRTEDVRKAVENAARTIRSAGGVSGTTNQTLSELLAELRQRNKLDFLVFADLSSGLVTSAAGGPPTRRREEMETAFADLIAAARTGSVTADTRLLSAAVLKSQDPALAERAALKMAPPSLQGAGPQGEISSGLVLIAVAPVHGRAGPAEVVYGGVLLNHNRELVDQIRRLIFGADLSGGRDIGSVSIFVGNVRIATTFVRQPGTLAEGTQVSSGVASTVLDHGDRWYGRAPVLNEWHLAAYEPIRDHTGRILGILGVGMQEQPFLAVRTDMMLTFLVVAAFGVLVVLGLTYLITRSMIHPLEEIVVASNIIAAGDLDHTVKVSARDEIGLLASSFNKMVASLKTMKLELEEWGRTLEEKVKKRTEELVTVQNQMAQSEKLASLGRLAAGVAHEINNPLGGILAFSSLALEECGENDPIRQNLEVVVKQTMRCRETVKGLLDFARQSTAAASATEINSVIEKTLSLLQNQSIFQNVKTVLKLQADLPQVLIDPGQLQQVVVNIALNAVDAMEESGTLTVETSVARASEEVLLRISDTGKGIPEGILPLIFEPFFTTKKVGQGTGLGLSIVHGIVTRAGGKIEVASSPRGAAFTIRLPIAREEVRDENPQISPSSADVRAGHPVERH